MLTYHDVNFNPLGDVDGGGRIPEVSIRSGPNRLTMARMAETAMGTDGAFEDTNSPLVQGSSPTTIGATGRPPPGPGLPAHRSGPVGPKGLRMARGRTMGKYGGLAEMLGAWMGMAIRRTSGRVNGRMRRRGSIGRCTIVRMGIGWFRRAHDRAAGNPMPGFT
jgi:hypothetical protein